MNMVDFIMAKKRGQHHSPKEIHTFIQGVVKGDVPDYQISAWLMAVYFQGLDHEERFALTAEMAKQGDQIDLSGIRGRVVDKHSTGGVGDKTTLAVGPIVAACGIPVAKLSGRGLGITGGTIDKLEAIPGFQTERTIDEMIRQVNQIGIALSSSTPNLVPADKKLYSLRDVTATTDELSLIAASIMSKKLAGGASAFVLDVKVGSGAFMKSVDEARKLAQTMVEIAEAHHREAVAILSDMNQPLGRKVGNALEVIEIEEILQEKGPDDITKLVVLIASHMVSLSLRIPLSRAEEMVKDAILSQTALQKWRQWVSAQGGEVSYLEQPERMLEGVREEKVLCKKEGVITRLDCEKIGQAALVLGAGRMHKDDRIDLGVGFDFKAKVGQKVRVDQCIVSVFYRDPKRLDQALELLDRSIDVGAELLEPHRLIWDIVR